MASKTRRSIPDEAFEALGFAVPALSRLIDRECKISLGAWLILWEVKRRGKTLDGRPIVLLYDLMQLFDERGFTRPRVSKLLNLLFDQRLIARPRLTTEERQAVFGDDGPRLAVVLTPDGEHKIEEFKDVLDRKFQEWHSRQRPLVRGAFKTLRNPAVQFAKALLKREAERAVTTPCPGSA